MSRHPRLLSRCYCRLRQGRFAGHPRPLRLASSSATSRSLSSSSQSQQNNNERHTRFTRGSVAAAVAAGTAAAALCATCLLFVGTGDEDTTTAASSSFDRSRRRAYAHTSGTITTTSDVHSQGTTTTTAAAKSPSSSTAAALPSKDGDDDGGRFGSLHGGALPEDFKAGDHIDGLVEFTREEVSKHTSHDGGVWVSYRSGVYDVTDFIDAHPGGSKIMLARGGAIDPFWDLYSIHKSQHAFKLIEQFRIGNLAAGDDTELTSSMPFDDPYRDEPKRHPALKVRSERPFNAETPLELIGDNFLVPSELFYVRNHLPTPLIDVDDYKLQIALSPTTSADEDDNEDDATEGGTFSSPFPPVHLSLADLKSKFKHFSVTTTMLCGGSRRSELSTVHACPGLPWGAGAISTATWTGVRLRDLLRYCGVEAPSANAQHVCFEGLDDPDTKSSFGSSVELAYALERGHDVLVAWEMNGEPLTRDHGFPLRVVIPGVIGARNVKWLRRIYLSPTESSSLWQAGPAYRVFPGTTRDPAHESGRGSPVYDPPVQSVFTWPSASSSSGVRHVHDIDSGKPLLASGYAFAGGGRSISYVEVSADNGKTWMAAELLPKPHFVDEERGRCWTWTLWRCQIAIPEELQKMCREAAKKAAAARGGDEPREEVFIDLAVRARDSGNNLQPEEAAHAWNYRGLLCNSWGRVRVPLACDDEEEDEEDDDE